MINISQIKTLDSIISGVLLIIKTIYYAFR